MYKEKYLKYKLKYLDLKGQIGGGQLIYHGTNLFYIDDIMTNGLTGKYNETIFNIMNTYYDTIKGSSKTGYIDLFFNRQYNVREDPSDIALSFTGKLDIAEEYSTGARQFGEGPSRFHSLFEQYIYNNKDKITDDMRKDYETINNAYKHPGIILAVDIDNIKDKRKLPEGSDYSKQPEITLTNPIDKSLLYIKIDNGLFVPLISVEGEEYIKRLNKQFLKEQEEEQRKIDEMIKHRTQLKETYGEGSRLEQDMTKETKPLTGWTLTYYIKGEGGPSYLAEDKSTTSLIQMFYNKSPGYDYLWFKIEKKTDIRIVIQIDYNTEKNKYISTILVKKGHELFESDTDLQKQFNLALNLIINDTFSLETKKKQLEKAITSCLQYLKEKKYIKVEPKKNM